MSVINFSDHAAHFFIKAPCGQIMYIAAAEKTVQFPFPRGLTHLCKDASTQAHMLWYGGSRYRELRQKEKSL